ncbi:MAG: MSHA pilin protein MshC [Rhodocyclaceae bacterium]|nr:MAG: MSHA pilin protein MshC [Rhodocyclaceae bacterium]TNC99251.1 MAG: MSHA pilin protein MshC [Rhodocyclaceae bacterium]
MMTQTPLRQRCQPGFTLIELVTVMLLVGILAFVVLPRLELLRGFDEIGYRDKVKATLEYARKSAVAQRRNVRVALAGNNLTLTIDNDVPDGGAAGTYPRSLSLPAKDNACGGPTNQICAPANVTLTGPATLTFTPLGRPDAAKSFTVSGGAGTITVEAETGYVH